MKIDMTCTQQQLDVLLSQIETILCQELDSGHHLRGPALAEEALKLPANGFSYDIAQLAPIYVQLVAQWEGGATMAAQCDCPEQQEAYAKAGREV